MASALKADPTGALRWYQMGSNILIDIARGLHFLHTNKIVHRHGAPALFVSD